MDSLKNYNFFLALEFVHLINFVVFGVAFLINVFFAENFFSTTTASLYRWREERR